MKLGEIIHIKAIKAALHHSSAVIAVALSSWLVAWVVGRVFPHEPFHTILYYIEGIFFVLLVIIFCYQMVKYLVTGGSNGTTHSILAV
jgi:hypothetical protein